MITGSKELIRDINTKLVLETILRHKSISRAAIAKQLGLTKATVSAIVQILINKKLVIEVGSDDTGAGRKPILLSLNKQAGYVVCIDLDGNTISALIADLVCEESSLKRVKTPKDRSGIVNALIELIESMKLTREAPYGLVGVTLGIHGAAADSREAFTLSHDLSDINIAEGIRQHFNTPVYLENEENLSVIGEKAFRCDYANIAYVSVHDRIGLGLIINDELCTGHRGSTGQSGSAIMETGGSAARLGTIAMEANSNAAQLGPAATETSASAGSFGHTVIEIDGRPCPCGNKGCLEQYVSERVLLREFAALKGTGEMSFAQFRAAYEVNDPDAQTILSDFVNYMSVAVNNILCTCHPDIVVINSSFTAAFTDSTERIAAALTGGRSDAVRVVPSELRDTSVLLGGVCVAVKGFLGIDLRLPADGLFSPLRHQPSDPA